MSFGRGRRRDPASGGATPGEPRPRPEDRRVDVYAAPGAQAEVAPAPEPIVPLSTPPAIPVVDVSAEEEADPENERDREARIDEMERALESFGRRRTPDYGRGTRTGRGSGRRR